MPRLASVPLALLSGLLLWGLGARSSAGDLFGKGADCNSQVVQLPAQQIVVETARPRVVVHETKLAKGVRVAPDVAPFVATFYTPVLPSTTPQDGGSLMLAHQMEMSLMQLERARAANEAELAAAQRVFDRIARSLPPPSNGGRGDAATAAQVQELNARLERLERLVLLHGEVLQKITTDMTPKPMPPPGTSAAKPTPDGQK
jgi:hypothetical protein